MIRIGQLTTVSSAVTSAASCAVTAALAATVLALGSVASAQRPDPERALTDAAVAADWRIPLHAAAVGPESDDPGVWTSGPDYKASFHDGFAFYPLLGADYPENLPLRWRTTRLTVAGRDLTSGAGAPAPRSYTDWRCETRHAGGWSEVYDVTERGIAQSFVLHARPALVGDLVVEGRIETRLNAPRRGATHEAIVFRDDRGMPIVRYGRAWVLDAAGRRAAIGSSYDGECIRLHVPGDWLADAAFPVTVDPLTSAVVLHSSSATAEDSDSVSTTEAFGSTILVVHTRRFSGGDADSYAQTMSVNLDSPHVIWSQVGAAQSIEHARCCYVDPEFVIVYERGSGIGTYSHDRRVGVANSGITRHLNPPSGRLYRRPEIGGSEVQPRCLVVYERASIGNPSGPTDVLGRLFFTTTHAFATAGFYLAASSGGTTWTRSSPTVTNSSSFEWLVAWQQRRADLLNPKWDVHVNVVTFQGVLGLPQRIARGRLDPNSHYFAPRADGDDDRYLVAFTKSDSTGLVRSLVHQRVDWRSRSDPIVLGPVRTLTTSASFRDPVSHYGVAFDQHTRSHWAIVYRRGDGVSVARVGDTGGVVESWIVASGAGVGAGGVGYWHARGTARGRFLVTYGIGLLPRRLSGRFLTYSSTAGVSDYGSGCGLSLTSSGEPYAGNGIFQLIVSSAAPTSPVVVLAAAGPAAVPLPLAPGCFLNLNPAEAFVVFTGTASSSGFDSFRLPLPDAPVFTGDLRFQGANVDPGANALGVTTSRGLWVRVR